MSLITRLSKLEARLQPKPTRYPSPALVEFVGAGGEPVDVSTIFQLSNTWPLAEVCQWKRRPSESVNEFIDRVVMDASAGALLLTKLG